MSQIRLTRISKMHTYLISNFGKRYPSLGVICIAFFLIAETSFAYPVLGQAQSLTCPSIDKVEKTEAVEPLYYILSANGSLELWFVDQTGQHKTDIQIDYPQNMNVFRTRISPSGNRIAILFVHAEGDPPRIKSSNANVAIVDIITKATQIYSLQPMQEYMSSAIPSSSIWLAQDILWDWFDDNQLIFNWSQNRSLLDVGANKLTVLDWPTIPPINNASTSRLSIPNVHRFIPFGKPAKPVYDDDFIYLTIFDSATKQIVRKDLPAKQSNISFDQSGSNLVLESPDESLLLLELVTGKDRRLTRLGWSEYLLRGLFVPSPDLSLIAFHTESRLASDSRIYLIESDSTQGGLMPVCQTGTNLYDIDSPSWSRTGQYQFAMLVRKDGKLQTHLFVYNARLHHLSSAITPSQFEAFSQKSVRVHIVGWGTVKPTS